MSFWERIKDLLMRRISDEEIVKYEWIQCPKCLVNIRKEDLIDNDMVCLSCSVKITIEEDKNS